MFLDSDINGGSWDSFDDDYSNFGNNLTNSIGNLFGTAGTQNKKKNINNIINRGGLGVGTGVLAGGYRPVEGIGKFTNQEVDLSAQNERLNDLTNKYLSKANSFSQENQSLRLQLKTAQEQNKNMMMYGLFGIIAILLITKTK
ncbi:hypothetical protein N8587_01435 [Akkermansiaceae bacterium]|nr:hypothetical protein [Akkermansiaceae bacterium]